MPAYIATLLSLVFVSCNWGGFSATLPSSNFNNTNTGSSGGTTTLRNCDLVSQYTNQATFETNELYIHLSTGSNINDIITAEAPNLTLLGSWNALNSYHVQDASGATLNQLATRLCMYSYVEFAERVLNTATTKYFSPTYDISNLTNPNPVVAVLATGIDLTHDTFINFSALWTNSLEMANGVDDDGNGFIDDIDGWDFANDDATIDDLHGSGTHDAGLIIQQDVDIFGAVVATSIKLMPVQVLDAAASTGESWVVAGILYATQNNADVIHFSLSGFTYSKLLDRAMVYANNRGVLLVAPAGNTTTDLDTSPQYPASQTTTNLISVAALTAAGALTGFTNYGLISIDLGALGTAQLSTIPGDAFGMLSGSTRSAAQVAGVAALAKTAAPQLSGYQVKSLVLQNVTNRPGLAATILSSGELNKAATVAAATGNVTPYNQPQD